MVKNGPERKKCNIFLALIGTARNVWNIKKQTMKIIIEIDTDTDLKPEELKTLQANAHLSGRTEAEQMKLVLLGRPNQPEGDKAA